MTPEEYKWVKGVASAFCGCTPYDHSACEDIRRLAKLALAEVVEHAATRERYAEVCIELNAALYGKETP